MCSSSVLNQSVTENNIRSMRNENDTVSLTKYSIKSKITFNDEKYNYLTIINITSTEILGLCHFHTITSFVSFYRLMAINCRCCEYIRNYSTHRFYFGFIVLVVG